MIDLTAATANLCCCAGWIVSSSISSLSSGVMGVCGPHSSEISTSCHSSSSSSSAAPGLVKGSSVMLKTSPLPTWEDGKSLQKEHHNKELKELLEKVAFLHTLTKSFLLLSWATLENYENSIPWWSNALRQTPGVWRCSSRNCKWWTNQELWHNEP